MKNILIIDDDESLSLIMNKRLPSDYNATYATTGEKGIALIRECSFDLVLLDLNLPGASGIGVLKFIRELYHQFELPVLMITASEDPKDLLEAFANGANDYISKSVDWKIKLARIATQVELKKLHHDATKMREVEAINALIVTYNHEINNPLSTAWIGIRRIQQDEDIKNKENLDRTIDGMERIKTVVKKIGNVLETKVEYTDYGAGSKMVKIK